MKTIILILFITPITVLSQVKDLSKNEAFQAFKISELRKSEKIPLSKFEYIYKTAKCVQKNYSDKEFNPDALKLKTMPIFSNKSAKKHEIDLQNDYDIISGDKRLFRYYGVFMAFPKTDDNGKKTQCL
ncbi:MAG: hypothetical protein DI539_28195 [Flavobacterium psychrophilum]|nr:MAG: hypothetical protein DI539_28195 [Flavobacterium psychrophilum]